jgi:hypothetical protein
MPYSFDEALAFLIDNKLTKPQFINIRKSAKKRIGNIYPRYYNVLTEMGFFGAAVSAIDIFGAAVSRCRFDDKEKVNA